MNGAERIAVERRRQVEGEHYHEYHDRGHEDELAMAAAAYAVPAELRAKKPRGRAPTLWPWRQQYWKPTPDDRVRELEKAGALVAAAIDAILARSES